MGEWERYRAWKRSMERLCPACEHEYGSHGGGGCRDLEAGCGCKLTPKAIDRRLAIEASPCKVRPGQSCVHGWHPDDKLSHDERAKLNGASAAEREVDAAVWRSVDAQP